jgi:hypothetical protein
MQNDTVTQFLSVIIFDQERPSSFKSQKWWMMYISKVQYVKCVPIKNIASNFNLKFVYVRKIREMCTNKKLYISKVQYVKCVPIKNIASNFNLKLYISKVQYVKCVPIKNLASNFNLKLYVRKIGLSGNVQFAWPGQYSKY